MVRTGTRAGSLVMPATCRHVDSTDRVCGRSGVGPNGLGTSCHGPT
jgi:hypothetical protein